jgi:predicted ATPase/class 3 adenylate cyclase
MTVEFGILGPLMMWSDGDPVDVTGAKRRGVLAYLLANAGEIQPLDRVVDAVWGERATAGSEATVQTYVSQLRKAFGANGPPLVYRAGGYVLDLDPGALDASRFEAAVAAATTLPDVDERLSLLDSALALWRGRPLDEFAGQPWADDRIRQWTRLYVLAHQLRAAALLDSGRHPEALPTLELLVTEHPLHEPFWAQLVVARYRCGEQSGALAAISEAREVLATELGIKPGPELLELEKKVLANDAALDAPASDTPAREIVEVPTAVEPLPDGVVTLFLTDIAGSTELWDRHPDDMAKALVRHEDLIAHVVADHNGRLLKTRGEGDSTLSVFAKATDAVTAAVALQRRLRNEAWPGSLEMPTRVAVHTGEAQLRSGDYYGGTVNRAARIRGLAAGGEVFCSKTSHDVVVDTLAADLELVPVGTHAMKGLSRAEDVYALRGPGLEVRAPRGEAIPSGPLASLVGRADIIERLDAALELPGLVTLIGPGGIGKTRLLDEACARMTNRFERVFRIDLVPAHDVDTVESALQNALLPAPDAMTRTPDPTAPRDLIAQLADQLRNRRVLMAVDNCEQLLDFLPQMIAALLAGAPTLTILATSREPFASAGEKVIPIIPLALPSASDERLLDRLGQIESVELLVRRVREAGGELTVTEETAADIADVCRQLDGIPLALELAAARLQSTSVRDLAARLPRQLELLAGRGGDPRHRSLRTAIDWSYELLEPAQQVLLRRLGIFAGGFTLEAAEEICCGDPGDVMPSGDAVYLNLAELVAKSLVSFDRNRSRYRLLEPIRQFARRLLETSGEMDAVADRHANWATRRSRETFGAWISGDGAAADRFRDELDNVHAALEWLRQHNERQFLRVVATLGVVWFQTDWRRGRATTDLAVGITADISDRLRAGVLLSRGVVEQRIDLDASRVWLAEARDLYLRIGDAFGAAWATYLLARGCVTFHRDEGRLLLLDAIERFHALSYPMGEIWCLINLGENALNYARFDEARGYNDRARELVRQSDERSLLGALLSNVARTTAGLGDVETARREMRDALEAQRTYGDTWNLVGGLAEAAWLEITANDYASAESLVRIGLEKGLEIDDRWQLQETLLILGIIRLRQGNRSAARELLAATDWEWETPEYISGRFNSIQFLASSELRSLADASDLEAAVQEGRRLGIFGAARRALQ